MRILDPGHLYEVISIDGWFPQIIQFVKRMGDKYPGNKGFRVGTTTQEVARCLLDRALFVNAQMPCMETEMMIHHLKAVIALCEIRNARIKVVHLPYNTLDELLSAPVDPTNGHVENSDE